MSVEIRQPRDEEIEDFVFAGAYAFNQDRRPEALQQSTEFTRAVYRREWLLGAYVDDRLAAGLRVLPHVMLLNGSALTLGAVSAVASLPEYRRQGNVSALLRHALSDMRDRGQFLSALYTPHVPLYRRFGWEVASLGTRYSFKPKDVRLTRTAVPGHARRVGPDNWATLNALYEEYAAQRNGLIMRHEIWWREATLGGSRPGEGRIDSVPQDIAIWESDDGKPLGYVIYHTRTHQQPDRRFPESTLVVRELVTMDADAYAGLINYILSHDIHVRIEWFAPPDEPFLAVVDDPSRVDVAAWPALMLRVVDLPKALTARGCLPAANEARLTLSVYDQAAPWNEGTWRIEAKEDRLMVEPASGGSDIEMDASTLASLFNGYLSPFEAARAGLLHITNRSALTDAAVIFSVTHPPFCMDWF